MFVRAEDADRALETMRAHPAGEQSVLIGEVVADHPESSLRRLASEAPAWWIYRWPSNCRASADVRPGTKRKPRDPSRQHRVPDECHAVDQGMRDDHRHHAAPSFEQPSEEQAHHDVADEPAEALIQVVRTADQCAGPDGAGPAPPDLAQSM